MDASHFVGDLVRLTDVVVGSHPGNDHLEQSTDSCQNVIKIGMEGGRKEIYIWQSIHHHHHHNQLDVHWISGDVSRVP